MSDTADHIKEARSRARSVLGGEANSGAVDDWRVVLASSRDALIVVWLVWVALWAFGYPSLSSDLLVVMSVGVAVLVGITTGRATHTQIQYYEAELERERREIREHFDDECEEVRVLYAAKGFQDPLLSQIVDTLSADEDRLLKVMMEEELGLSMHHMRHPLQVGLSNFAGALAAGLTMALPSVWLSQSSVQTWMPAIALGLLLGLSAVGSYATQRKFAEIAGASVLTAIIAGGIVFFLAQWLAGAPAASVVTDGAL